MSFPVRYNVSFQTPSDLSGFDASFKNGDTAFVESLGYGFTYDVGSVKGADDVTVINGPGTPPVGRWIAATFAQKTVIVRPAGTASPGVLTTWAEVASYADTADGPVTFLLDFTGSGGTVTIPAGAYDLKGSSIFAYEDLGSANSNILALAPGAQLKNVSEIGGRMTVESQETTAGFPSFEWDRPAAPYSAQVSFTVSNGLTLTSTGTQPLIIVDPAKYRLNMRMQSGTQWYSTGAFCIRVNLNGVVQLKFYGVDYLDQTTLVQSADGTATLYVISDGTGPYAPREMLSFLGTISWYLIGGNAVATTARPTPNQPGASVFDTGLNKPIWWTGAAWVDATGLVV